MRKTISLLSIIAVLLCSYGVYAQVKNTDDAVVIKRLKGFYTFYITENDGIADQKKVTDTLKRYCTAAFFRKVHSAHPDADLIVDAQDFDKDWVRTLKVSKAGSNVYSVCFMDNYTKKMHCVTVFMQNEGGQWKISKITPAK